MTKRKFDLKSPLILQTFMVERVNRRHNCRFSLRINAGGLVYVNPEESVAAKVKGKRRKKNKYQ